MSARRQSPYRLYSVFRTFCCKNAEYRKSAEKQKLSDNVHAERTRYFLGFCQNAVIAVQGCTAKVPLSMDANWHRLREQPMYRAESLEISVPEARTIADSLCFTAFQRHSELFAAIKAE